MKSTRHSIATLLAQHWLLAFNTFFVAFAVLPILAPILLARGYTNIAGLIYRIYGFTCHQMPSHSDFIAGHQVAVCQRCNAIHVMLALAGIIYAARLFRFSVMSFKWFLLFMIPMGIDGGMALVSELSVFIPLYPLWIIGIIIIIVAGGFLIYNGLATWQVYLFFAAGPVSLLYVQIFGPHTSNWWLRTITGAVYALGAIWFIYPIMEESSCDTQQEAQTFLLTPDDLN